MEFVEATITISTQNITCLIGLCLLGYWLLTTSLGRKALADSVPRRNNVPGYMPAALLLIWFGPVQMATLIAQELTADPKSWQGVLVSKVVFCIAAAATAVFIILLARAHFARRLKGFGLDIRTILRDIPAAFANLLAVCPLMYAAIMLTIFIGQEFQGGEYQVPPHEELKLVAARPELPVRIAILVATAVVVPVLEELMFRGFLQTTIRSFFKAGNGAWLAIAITSWLFAMLHADVSHWPALFLLGACMGYSYEKSGSLFRPIFIHAIFNATNVMAAMNN